MTRYANKGCPSITRRSFIATSACILGLGMLSPSTALAEGVDADTQSDDMTAADYWSIAEEKARDEGSPVICGSVSDEDLERFRNTPQARYLMSIFARSEGIWIDYTILDAIQAVLVVDHTSPTTVGSFINTWVQLTYCTVTNLTYQRTILDGGRTIAISYVFTVTSPYGTNSAIQCYCEFYYNGTGRVVGWNWI